MFKALIKSNMSLTPEYCRVKFETLDPIIQKTLIRFVLEMERAEVLHPNYPTAKKTRNGLDFIYATAIVSEEAGELVRASLDHHQEGNLSPHHLIKLKNNMNIEAIQVGSAALRFLKNL